MKKRQQTVYRPKHQPAPNPAQQPPEQSSDFEPEELSRSAIMSIIGTDNGDVTLLFLII